MSYIGDFALGKTFDTKFCTVNTSGVPTTLAGTPVISAYVDNSLTQITAGITLTVDFDAVTGLHNIRVVATGANGYATASNYQLVITTGTVGGSSVVGYVVAEFSIEARSAIRPTTADRTLDVSATGEAGLDWANIGSPTTAQNLSATNIDVDQVVASVSGAVGSVAAGGITASSIAADAIGASELAADAVAEIADAIWDEDATGHQTLGTYGQAIGDPVADANTIYGAVVTGAVGATVAADIITVQADTDDIQARLPAALVGGRIDSSVGAMAANVVTAAAVADGAIDALTFAAGAIDAAAIAANAIGASELAADAVAEIADGVWDEARAGHATLGTYGDSYIGIVTGSAVAGTLSTTQMSTDLTEATDSHYNGRLIVWTSGVLTGQASDITAYTGATKVITYTAITEAPAAGDDFVIY